MIEDKNKFSKIKTSNDQGFTFLEFIFVVTLLGLTSRLVIPSFITSLNKSRQKEASLIVNSIIKSTKSYYGIHAFLPKNIGQLSKFANYQKCNAKEVDEGFHGKMLFDEVLIHYKIKTDYLEDEIQKMIDVMNSTEIPNSHESCENCAYARQRSAIDKLGGSDEK